MIMSTSALVALDSTIVATAVPSIVEDIDGFTQFPWLFSVYLLAQAITVPLFGKLADLYGRRPVLQWGVAVFLLGSLLCGLAWSMPSLIVFRLVQGVGAGATQAIGITIAGDQFSVRERGRVQAHLAAVWAVCSVSGPAIGGLFAEYLTWRWIFLVNVPICLVVGALSVSRFKETFERREVPLDWRGAAVLTAGAGLVVLGLLEGGQAWAWVSLPGIGVPSAGVLLLAVFVILERRALEPVLPLWVFTRRLLLTCNVAAGSVGAVVFGLTSYVPTFAQEVLGARPLVAGVVLAALTLGWSVAAGLAARLYLKVGFHGAAVVGAALAVAGCSLLPLLDEDSSAALWQLGLSNLVVGLGVGLILPSTLIAAQSSVSWSQRGVVTANSLFSRSVGSAVGVAIFSAVANSILSGGQTVSSRHDLASATHHVFIGTAIVALIAAAAAASMPRGVLNDQAAVQPPSTGITDPVM